MFGRPNPVRNRKKLRRFKGQLAPFGHFLALNLSQAPKGNVPDPVETSLISSKPNLVRESREREREASESSDSKLEDLVLPMGFLSWTILLIDFLGNFSRCFHVFPYFRVWGNRLWQGNILFHKKNYSFWSYKISVHLGFVEQIFTRKCFKRFLGLQVSKLNMV